jgi:hypothetical protein
MAHFAEVNEDGIVTRVLVVHDSQEHRGQDFLANDLGLGGTWIQTSYNKQFRHHFAGVGYKYDAERNAFVPPQPYPSWILRDGDSTWHAPKPQPEGDVIWDEEEQEWVAR